MPVRVAKADMNSGLKSESMEGFKWESAEEVLRGSEVRQAFFQVFVDSSNMKCSKPVLASWLKQYCTLKKKSS